MKWSFPSISQGVRFAEENIYDTVLVITGAQHLLISLVLGALQESYYSMEMLARFICAREAWPLLPSSLLHILQKNSRFDYYCLMSSSPTLSHAKKGTSYPLDGDKNLELKDLFFI